MDVNVARLLEFTLGNSAMDDSRRVYFDDFVIIFSLVRVEESKWYVGDWKFAFQFNGLISYHWIESLSEYIYINLSRFETSSYSSFTRVDVFKRDSFFTNRL